MDESSGGGGGVREAIRLYEFNGIKVGSNRRPNGTVRWKAMVRVDTTRDNAK